MAVYSETPPGFHPPGFYPPGFHFYSVTTPERRLVQAHAARPVVLKAFRRIAPDKAEPGPPPTTP